jgi:hypothetical protein
LICKKKDLFGMIAINIFILLLTLRMHNHLIPDK